MKKLRVDFYWEQFSLYRSILMGCAIIGIVLCHLDIAQLYNGLTVSGLGRILNVFTAFVDVFLFLSGLGLYYSFQKNTDQSYSDFIKRRLIKIVPIYLILSSITYIIWDVIINKGTFLLVLEDIFFVSWIKSGSTKYWFVLAIIIFYMIFPVLYHYLYKGGNSLLRFVLLLVLYVAVTGLLHHYFKWYDTFKIAIERFPIFVFGIYCGKLSYEHKKISKYFVIGISQSLH